MKRKKKSPLTLAKDKAWKAFSIYIRTKGSIGNLNTCITCRRMKPISAIGGLQAGHFVPGRTNATLFDERGVYPQCYGCNVGKKSNPIKFYKFMLKTHGQKVIDELDRLSGTTVKYTVQDYLKIEKKYKRKLVKLTLNQTLC